MKIKLSEFDPKLRKVIQDIGRSADQQGLSAYVVGGIVRDTLLRRKNLDCDIVIAGDAIDFAKHFCRGTQTVYQAYPQFGTATLRWPSGLQIDLVSARKEDYPSPGALPVVRPGTLRDDLFRRDFAVNALAVGINQKNFGQLIDEFAGRQDLRQRQIRILHDQSFIDDPTRILRAVRFEQRLDFHLEKHTLALLRTALQTRAWESVKLPRYFAEFRKILSERDPVRPIARLQDLGGLGFVAPHFRPPLSLLKLLEKNIRHLRRDRYFAGHNWSAVYLLSLFSGLSCPKREKLSARFPLTRGEKEALKDLVKLKKLEQGLSHPRLSPSEVYLLLRQVNLEIIYFILARTSDRIIKTRIRIYLAKSLTVRLAVCGNDLKDIVGGQGKRLGAVLRQLLLQKINGKINTKNAEIHEAKNLAAQFKA